MKGNKIRINRRQSLKASIAILGIGVGVKTVKGENGPAGPDMSIRNTTKEAVVTHIRFTPKSDSGEQYKMTVPLTSRAADKALKQREVDIKEGDYAVKISVRPTGTTYKGELVVPQGGIPEYETIDIRIDKGETKLYRGES